MTAPELVVDARGRRCPLPVLDLARQIREVPVGRVVVVLADDAAARHDIPAWCAMKGHDYLGEDRTGDGPAYAVRRRS